MIDKGFISRYKEFIQLNNRKSNNPTEINEWRTQTFFQRTHAKGQLVYEKMLHIIREMKIKTPMRHHFRPFRMAITIKTRDNRCR